MRNTCNCLPCQRSRQFYARRRVRGIVSGLAMSAILWWGIYEIVRKVTG